MHMMALYDGWRVLGGSTVRIHVDACPNSRLLCPAAEHRPLLQLHRTELVGALTLLTQVAREYRVRCLAVFKTTIT